VPKEVGGTATRTADARTGKRPPNNMSDSSRAAETYRRRPHSQKNLPRGVTTTVIPQIPRQGLADLGGQRQSLQLAAFPANRDFACTPMDVIQFHGDDFSGSQRQSRKKQQDGVIAPAARSGLIRAGKHSLDLL
jgi:hypothetical protein